MDNTMTEDEDEDNEIDKVFRRLQMTDNEIMLDDAIKAILKTINKIQSNFKEEQDKCPPQKIKNTET
jgi:hypothetical protein